MKKRTDGSGLDHVADGESLDCLVLRCAAGAVAAADWVDVATAILVATVCCSLLDHICDLCGSLGGEVRWRLMK